MDANIKDKWTEMVSDSELNIEANWMYTLLNPNDKEEFFKIVNIIVTRHKERDDEEERRGNQVWTKEYEMEFKMTAVRYMIEIEKDNQVFIPTPSTAPTTYPISIPYTPNCPSCPKCPNIPDTMPWQTPIIYCKNPDNVFYCTTT